MSEFWTDEQLELLTLHWREMTDAQLARLVSAHGPVRTAKAIESFRHARNWKHPRGFASDRAAAIARAGYLKSIDNQGGWPLLEGTPEEREKRYLRLMFEGLREEQRRLSERKVA